MTKNRLALEKSPYLLQHANNPVDWFPWGNEAFEKAAKEGKPVFLSIGYSTCHWCHVMEKESFEDPDVAKLMNDFFVSIKVDREERPDLDNIYMTAAQMMAGRGGWPLNIILTPDKKPFYAMTYLPKEGRLGMAGMLDIIPRINEVWAKRRNEVIISAGQITSALDKSQQEGGEELGEGIIKEAYMGLAQRFDKEHGGFSRAPKFPSPHNILFLFRYWRRTGDKEALNMAEKTLTEMRMGGIFDHIGFGFHRYSTDSNWLVPHFEKMLYDQAMLAMAYTEGFQATGRDEYGRTASEIFTYVLRDMRSSSGGFYSGEDADSEGQEGRFYLWTEDETRRILAKEEEDLVSKAFNVEEQGNFIEEGTGSRTGENIFHLKGALKEIAVEMRLSEKEFMDRLEGARKKLFTIRENRVHPYKDDKVLTDWNGLMIAALARGASAFDMPEYSAAAARAAGFILDNMRLPDGRLLHRHRDGESAITACLDDYAFLIWGLIELYETLFDVKYLNEALELNRDMLSHFWDEKGGFFFTPDDGEELIVRNKEIYDGAIPSGNSVAMLDLIRLSRITGDPALEKMAAMIGSAFSRDIAASPSGYTHMMVSLDYLKGPSCEIVIAGDTGAEDTWKMLKAVVKHYAPSKVVLFRPTDVKEPEITRIAPFTRSMTSITGKTVAYVCKGYTCLEPTSDINRMLELLDK